MPLSYICNGIFHCYNNEILHLLLFLHSQKVLNKIGTSVKCQK